MSDQTTEHYERVAATYDEHWGYNPDYVKHFASTMVDALRLTQSDVIADIGCGTGLYSRQLCEELEPTHPMLCVDPVAAMLDQLPASPHLQPLLARAEDLAFGLVEPPDAAPLDAIIMKESVHHVASPRETLRGLVD